MARDRSWPALRSDRDSSRHFVIAADGKAWTLDLLIDGEYGSVPAADSQLATTLEQAKQLAQEWESELC